MRLCIILVAMALMTRTEIVCQFRYNTTITVSFPNNAKSKEHFAKKLIKTYALFDKTIQHARHNMTLTITAH